MTDLSILGRKRLLFVDDLEAYGDEMNRLVEHAKFLVVGGAGTIGQAVCLEIFKRNPRVLHVVDISENNLVELVRDIRSSHGYIEGDFQTFALDYSSIEFDMMLAAQGPYDYVLNLAALKHVRSEKDPFTLMRMIDVNIIQTERLRRQVAQAGSTKYFCVSTDKATNPVNMMGCSKRIMEQFLFGPSSSVNVSTARFANVAFSDGSLLHGFEQRLSKGQPLSAPTDVRRYFVSKQEAGLLCLSSCLLGANREIFFPKLDEGENLTSFADIAIGFLASRGLEATICASEEDARRMADTRVHLNKWPVFFFQSDTTGEKSYEEFYTDSSDIDWDRFTDMGVIKMPASTNAPSLNSFLDRISEMKARKTWDRATLVKLFIEMVPEFSHIETGKFLDSRM